MQSMNFTFISKHRPELEKLGALAEHHLYIDPASSLVKLRSFAEEVVKGIYADEKLPRLVQPSLNDLINNHAFQEVTPKPIIHNLNFLRIQGNSCAHGEDGETRTASMALGIAHQIAAFIAVRYCSLTKNQIPEFQSPPEIDATKARLKKEKKAALELARQKSEEVEKLLKELEDARSKQVSVESTPEERADALSTSQQAAETLGLTEAKTRKLLIDTLLQKAGWDITDEHQVSLEYKVDHQPTSSGKGYADYVLWDDNGKPLAVIEAKKTSVEISAGREQSRIYADGLEKMFGQRPVIFYSNGYETAIWDDSQYNSSRKVYGFYSKASLQYLLYQRNNRHQALEQLNPDSSIAGRFYQINAIKQVSKRFQDQYRQALVVQATGTGKTRVAIALSELLIRAGWAKRILFLCDRKELRKQADDNFKEHLPSEPRFVIGSSRTVDNSARIYVATYPGMMGCFEQFDVGYFDLIIADESHRSIYNKYREIFLYFDAMQVGLTATPVKFLERNTFTLFGCENTEPTFNFDLDEAVNNDPPFLVPFRVKDLTTEFLRRGIKYSQMTAKQRQELEEQELEAETVEYENSQVGAGVINKDTDRIILRNLEKNGIQDAHNSLVGKSIVFARNQKHAVHLQQLFCELFPDYGDEVCKVIHSSIPRAEALIDEFKQPGNNFRIAISVDMLDTGIDVPEVVNLVFAKPVKSYVKFWQMIGRGTRLCPDLFGLGKDKKEFLIFDHFGNFEYFEEQYKEAEVSGSKSLLEQLFSDRIALAKMALDQKNRDAFDTAISLLRQDLNDLPQDSVTVMDKLQTVHQLQQEGVIEDFTTSVREQLASIIAPLMGSRILRDPDAVKFDRLVALLQADKLSDAASFEDRKLVLIEWLNQLAININAVRAKDALIKQLQTAAWWANAGFSELEQVRLELRGIMKYRDTQTGSGTRVIDITEDKNQIKETERHPYSPSEQLQYRQKVQGILKSMFDTNPTLQKIRRQEPVSDDDLQSLTSLVMTQHPGVDLSILTDFFPNSAGQLHLAIQALVGLESEEVEAHFTDFVQNHPQLNALQVKFLGLLKSYISEHGFITVATLYQPPFSHLHQDGVDGVFGDEIAGDLVSTITPFVAQPTTPDEQRTN